MSGFDLSPAAASDIEGIAAYLDDHAAHATDQVLAALLNAMRRLAEHPGLGHLREDLADEPLRFHPVWSYLVIYRESERIEIVRVLHAARDVARELDSGAWDRRRKIHRLRLSLAGLHSGENSRIASRGREARSLRADSSSRTIEGRSCVGSAAQRMNRRGAALWGEPARSQSARRRASRIPPRSVLVA